MLLHCIYYDKPKAKKDKDGSRLKRLCRLCLLLHQVQQKPNMAAAMRRPKGWARSQEGRS